MSILRLASIPLLGHATLLATSLWSSSAHAGGYYVPEQGARAMALGGAVTAFNPDLSTLIHNPAALVVLPGTQFQLNGSGVMLNIRHWRRPVERPDGTLHFFDKTQNTNGFGAVPSFFASSDLGVKNLRVALGVYVPFGADLEFPATGSQRYIVTKTSLRNYYVTPTVAYKLKNGLSFGLGLSYVYSTLELEQANSADFVIGGPDDNPIPKVEGDGVNALRGKDKGSFGANLGVQYHDPQDRFALGLSAMLPTTVDFVGPAYLKSKALADGATLGGEFEEKGIKLGERDDRFHTQFKNPLVVRAGFMARPIPSVRVSMDVNWQRWSTSRSLEIDFEENWPMQNIPGATIYDQSIPLAWKDTLAVRVGGEYQPQASLPLFLRLGALYDQSPVKDEYFDLLVPDSDRTGISGGAGFDFALSSWGRMKVDVSYLHYFLKKRDIGPVNIGPDQNVGNDKNASDFDDSAPNSSQKTIPGSLKTIQNRPAASFFYGVTRASADVLGLSVTLSI